MTTSPRSNAAPDPYTTDGLATLLEGTPRYRRDQVAEWLAKGVDDPEEMTNLPTALREQLVAVMPPSPRVLTVSTADGGLTRKVLLECGGTRAEADGGPDPTATEAVESVLMLYPPDTEKVEASGSTAPSGRATVCISTQAGCAMGCPFCATGQMGFRRQLTVAETVSQVTVMQRLLAGGFEAGHPVGDALAADPLPPLVPDHVTNVVFMGMGEPLANLDVTLESVRWLHDTFGLSARSITVSTVGLVPGIRQLQSLDLPLTLAVSLHAPDDDLRDDLVPVNRQHPMAELLSATRDYLEATGRRVTFEYVMIDGVNSSTAQAATLGRLLNRHMPKGAAHVNLIPMNPTPAVPWVAPSVEGQRAFATVLGEQGIGATIRYNRGNEIDAACGQLFANYTQGSGRTLPAAVGAFERISGLQGGTGSDA